MVRSPQKGIYQNCYECLGDLDLGDSRRNDIPQIDVTSGTIQRSLDSEHSAKQDQTAELAGRFRRDCLLIGTADCVEPLRIRSPIRRVEGTAAHDRLARPAI